MGVKVDKQEPKKDAAAEPSPPPPLREQLAGAVATIQKAVAAKDTRALSGRLMRQTAGFRKQLTADDLQAFLAGTLPPSSSSAQTLQHALRQAGVGDGMETDAAAENGSAAAAAAAPPPVSEPLPELEVYAFLLVITLLADQKKWLEVNGAA